MTNKELRNLKPGDLIRRFPHSDPDGIEALGTVVNLRQTGFDVLWSDEINFDAYSNNSSMLEIIAELVQKGDVNDSE